MMKPDKLRTYPDDFYRFITEGIGGVTGWRRYHAICDFHKVLSGESPNKDRSSVFNTVIYDENKHGVDYNDIFLAEITDTLLRDSEIWKKFRLGYNDLVNMDFYNFKKLKSKVERQAKLEQSIVKQAQEQAEQESRELQNGRGNRKH